MVLHRKGKLRIAKSKNHHVCHVMKLSSKALNVFDFLDCPVSLSLPKIRGTTVCHITKTCTAISCCVEVGKVSRTFELQLDIDFCNQKLTFGIEKLTETISLQGFEYGM
jgi:hypothetical protein